MNGRKFLLYSRGFMGSAENATHSSAPTKTRTLLSVFNLNPEETKHTVVNEQIVQAYNQLMRRQVLSTDFDWRERVIKAALRSFGTLSMREWVQACERSPMFTQTHADCIADWLRFCETGKRKLPPITWERLISPGANEPTDPACVDRDVLRSVSEGYSYANNISLGENNIATVLTQVLARPGGYSDLVITLYTFFGENNS